MHEWKDSEKNSSSGKQLELDKRLAAYYGPELREQPLSSASWQRLRSQLNTRRSTRHRQRSRLRGRWHRRQSFVPAYVQETFSRISYEARVPYPQSLLQCSLNTRVHMPTVRVSTLGKHKIKLILPSIAEGAIGQPGVRCTRSCRAGALSVCTQTGAYHHACADALRRFAGIYSIAYVLEAKPPGYCLSCSCNTLYPVAAACAGAQAGFPCRLLDSIVAWTRAHLPGITRPCCSYTLVIPAGMGRAIVSGAHSPRMRNPCRR